MERQPMTEREIAIMALDVQDACNLSGVVHSLDRVVSDLAAIGRAQGRDAQWSRRHPAVKLFCDKLADLAEVRDMAQYSRAYDECKALAAG